MSTEAEWAWAAGLFEGEGCISFHSQARGGWNRQLTLATTDHDVLHRFVEIVGAGNVYERPRQGTLKLLYVWRCQNWDGIEPILSRFLPHLGQRRSAKAREMLARAPRPPRRVNGRFARAEATP